ncbi:unnamed protein product [Arabidopsis thaliana]|uniref:Transmembrane protein n=1 Tax=Arabidopsis thaliana TaxID=3702 RepID=A0A5S9X145_ARATH|nr:unnamed protein product [Arabidopsis thaliana]
MMHALLFLLSHLSLYTLRQKIRLFRNVFEKAHVVVFIYLLLRPRGLSKAQTNLVIDLNLASNACVCACFLHCGLVCGFCLCLPMHVFVIFYSLSNGRYNK